MSSLARYKAQNRWARTSNDVYRGQILLSDGSTPTAIIKDLTPKELANELIGAVLARAAGLPTPRCYLTLAPAASFAAQKGPRSLEGDPFVFARVDVDVPSIQFQARQKGAGILPLIFELADWPLLGGLYAFDSWTANTDRNAGNLLFSSGSAIWLIDHGWCFTGPSWSPADLTPLGDHRHRLACWLTPHLNEAQITDGKRQAASSEGVMKAIDLEATFDASRAADILSTDEVAAARGFLHGRIGVIAYYSNKALGAPTVV